MEKRYIMLSRSKETITEKTLAFLKDGYELVGVDDRGESLEFQKEHPVWKIINPIWEITNPNGAYTKEGAKNIEGIYNFIEGTISEIGVSDAKSLYRHLTENPTETLAILKSLSE